MLARGYAGKTKRLYVAARSRGVPTARRKLLSKVWTNVDADGSGTLDRDEVKSVLLRMGRKEESIDIDAVVSSLPRSAARLQRLVEQPLSSHSRQVRDAT